MSGADAVAFGPAGAAASDAVLARIVREEAGRIVASLTAWTGDFDIAEDAVAEAVSEALTQWRRRGTPPNPGAWLTVAARHNALDRLRRDKRYREKILELPEPVEHVPGEVDERVPLLFGCCHPALGADAQLALTLRAICGLTTAQIARATITPTSTVAQRIVRAKRKITASGIPLRVPPVKERAERLDLVLTIVSVVYSEAHLVDGGDSHADRDLADDAVWLARVIANAMPREAEAWGLLALLLFHSAREPARAVGGEIVLLAQQDRSLWDPALLAQGHAALEAAARLGAPGKWQLHAAIAACHSDARRAEETDWAQIVVLYDLLLGYDGSPVVFLNRAVARAEAGDVDAALADVDALEPSLARFHLWHAVRADLLRRHGREAEARECDRRALELTANDAERRLLSARLAR